MAALCYQVPAAAGISLVHQLIKNFDSNEDTCVFINSKFEIEYMYSFDVYWTVHHPEN